MRKQPEPYKKRHADATGGESHIARGSSGAERNTAPDDHNGSTAAMRTSSFDGRHAYVVVRPPP